MDSVLPVVLIFAVLATVGVVLDTFWLAAFRATPQGKFKVSVNNSSSFSFVTKLGGFSVDRGKQALSFAVAGRRGLLALSEIKGLEYRARVEAATIQELFLGLDLTDVFSRYRDTIEWYSISAVTTKQERIPIYLGGEYQRREFLMTWYIDLQTALLEKLGVSHDEGAESRKALGVIQQQLGNVQLI
jgi:hypothetical protein